MANVEWGFNPDQGYFEIHNNRAISNVEVSQENWELYQELKGQYLFAKTIFGRVQLRNFIALIEEVGKGNATPKEVLAFINPGKVSLVFSDI